MKMQGRISPLLRSTRRNYTVLGGCSRSGQRPCQEKVSRRVCMSKTVFILGAGASFEGGGPLMGNFLEVADTLRHSPRIGTYRDRAGKEHAYREDFDRVFKARAQLQPVHSKAALDLYNLESVFGAFEMAKRFRKNFGSLNTDEVANLSQSMRRLIMRSLELTMRFVMSDGLTLTDRLRLPHPYGQFGLFLHNLAKTTSVSIITFNYDIAVDSTLWKYKLQADYCLEKEPLGSGVPLMKLHGSINWTWCERCKRIAAWPLKDFFDKYLSRWQPDHPGPLRPDPASGFTAVEIASWMDQFIDACGEHMMAGSAAIVPPTWEKTDYSAGFENIWAHAANHLAEAENIVVIGYSLPPTDQFFPILYALGTVSETILKRFWVFDPDDTGAVRKRFQEMLGPAAKQKFQFRQETFGSAIGFLGIQLW